MLHPPYPPLPEAGPSRRPLELPPTSRSTSLTPRQRGKMPMPTQINTDRRTTTPLRAAPHDFPTHPHTSGPRYDYRVSPSSPTSLRRSVSDEGGRSRSYAVPNVRAPPISPTQAELLHHVREKMSSQDQEAMKRLRQTMAGQSKKPAVDPLSPVGDRFPPRAKMAAVEDAAGDVGEDRSREKEDVGRDQNRTPRPLDARESRAKQGVPFNIAVIGHPGVGKTTVIVRATKAWGVSDPITTILSSGLEMFTHSSHVQPGGKLKEARSVNYIELDISALNLSSSSGTLWEDEVPPISGVILCYDATRAGTLESISEALSWFISESAHEPQLTQTERLSSEGIPMIILACKSDPEAKFEVDAAYANSLGEAYNVGLIEVSALTPEGKSKMRNGLRWLLFKLEQRHRKQPKAPTHIDLQHLCNSQTQPIQPLPPDTAVQSPAESSEGHSSGGERIMWGQHGTGGMGSGEMRVEDKRSSSGSLEWIMSAPVNVENGAAAQPCDLLPDTNGEQLNGVEMEKENTQPDSQTPEAVVSLSMDDLYRKVFSSIVTKENEHLVSSFFLTYRRFATPLDVMLQFRYRFEDVSEAEIPKDLKMLVLQRLIGALVEWACEYPGDIVSDKVQGVYRDILAATLRYRYLTHLSAELVTIESQLLDVDDIDTSWSFGLPVLSVITESNLDSSTEVDLSDDPPEKAEMTPIAPKRTSYSSINVASSSALSLTTSTASQDPKGSSLDLWRNASTPRLLDGIPPSLAPVHDFGFSKWSSAWNTFMRYDPRAFAVDLTKMQWQRFAVIRPRDVFRHDFGKERDGPVGYSIEFFNHVSRWVSTMILANPKPKHRARTYERLAIVVHHLRRLNNYDSLYAVMSGMRETSIHRLAQTHALVVPSAASRDFEGYVRLMDPRRGYAEYSKALEVDMASGTSVIPLLTVILGQINRLQAARPADKEEDGAIKWDKFLLFGQILWVVTACQQRGPMMPGEPSLAFQALMENTNVITSEDALFERSRMLEPPNGLLANGSVGGGGGVKKAFAKINLGTAFDFRPEF